MNTNKAIAQIRRQNRKVAVCIVKQQNSELYINISKFYQTIAIISQNRLCWNKIALLLISESVKTNLLH